MCETVSFCVFSGQLCSIIGVVFISSVLLYWDYIYEVFYGLQGPCSSCLHGRYDINYIEESMGWNRPLHGIGGSHDIPSSASLSTQGDLNKGMSLDSSSATSGIFRNQL